jgi:hypothetical protein
MSLSLNLFSESGQDIRHFILSPTILPLHGLTILEMPGLADRQFHGFTLRLLTLRLGQTPVGYATNGEMNTGRNGCGEGELIKKCRLVMSSGRDGVPRSPTKE